MILQEIPFLTTVDISVYNLSFATIEFLRNCEKLDTKLIRREKILQKITFLTTADVNVYNLSFSTIEFFKQSNLPLRTPI